MINFSPNTGMQNVQKLGAAFVAGARAASRDMAWHVVTTALTPAPQDSAAPLLADPAHISWALESESSSS